MKKKKSNFYLIPIAQIVTNMKKISKSKLLFFSLKKKLKKEYCLANGRRNPCMEAKIKRSGKEEKIVLRVVVVARVLN